MFRHITAQLGLRSSQRFSSSLFKPRKFYKNVSVNADENGLYEIFLDKRKLKTPQKKLLELRSESLALAIAQEWDSQKDVLYIPGMRLTGLAFTAVDNPTHETRLVNMRVIKPCSEGIVDKLMEYLDNDTILYMNSAPSELVELEQQSWLPIIEWANQRHELRLKPSYSLTEMAEIPEESRSRVRRHFEAMNFYGLTGAIYGVDSIKSVLLALACFQGRISGEEAGALTNLEQEYQSKIYQKVNGHHDLQALELVNRICAASLFVHLTSNWHTTTENVDHCSC